MIDVWVWRVRGQGRSMSGPITLAQGGTPEAFIERCHFVASKLYPLDEGEHYEFTDATDNPIDGDCVEHGGALGPR